MFYYCSQGVMRNINEAVYICVNDPSLNRNLGKYQLPHMRLGSTGHSSSPAQITQLYLPLHRSICPPTTIVGEHTTSLVNIVPCGVPSLLTPIVPYTSPHTPNTQNAPNSPTAPIQSCHLWQRKYTHLFM